MIINVNSGSSGWANYVLNGTKNKPRDQSKVEIIDGDLELGDLLSEENSYEQSYYSFVLGFKGKESDEVMLKAYNHFKREFFTGIKEDEYHIDAVIHKDTDDYHIHARVPKQNLLTDTNLQLYYDKIDRPRKELIQDHISLTYGFEIARETNREIIKEQAHEHIEKWRDEANQPKFDFSKKKDKQEAESKINEYILDMHQNNLLEKHEDITNLLEELDLKVERYGTDIKKDFSYVTVSNSTGKIRVKGELFNERFWEYSREDRSAQIESNQRARSSGNSGNERLKTVRKELDRANKKRRDKVNELFKKGRERARKKLEQVNSYIEHQSDDIHINTIDTTGDDHWSEFDVFSESDVDSTYGDESYPQQSEFYQSESDWERSRELHLDINPVEYIEDDMWSQFDATTSSEAVPPVDHIEDDDLWGHFDTNDLTETVPPVEKNNKKTNKKSSENSDKKEKFKKVAKKKVEELESSNDGFFIQLFAAMGRIFKDAQEALRKLNKIEKLEEDQEKIDQIKKDKDLHEAVKSDEVASEALYHIEENLNKIEDVQNDINGREAIERARATRTTQQEAVQAYSEPREESRSTSKEVSTTRGNKSESLELNEQERRKADQSRSADGTRDSEDTSESRDGVQYSDQIKDVAAAVASFEMSEEQIQFRAKLEEEMKGLTTATEVAEAAPAPIAAAASSIALAASVKATTEAAGLGSDDIKKVIKETMRNLVRI